LKKLKPAGGTRCDKSFRKVHYKNMTSQRPSLQFLKNRALGEKDGCPKKKHGGTTEFEKRGLGCGNDSNSERNTAGGHPKRGWGEKKRQEGDWPRGVDRRPPRPRFHPSKISKGEKT